MADPQTTIDNPFTPPAEEPTVASLPWKDRKGAIALRRAHLRQESALRFAGNLYLLLGGVRLISAPAIFERSGWLMSALIAALVGLVFLTLGQAIRTLNRCAVPFATVFAFIGLVVPYGMLVLNAAVSAVEIPYLPIEALLNGSVLYLLYSQRGRFVFSDRYQEIRAQTADFPVAMSPTQKVLFASLCLLAVLFTLEIARIPLERLLR
jgi:hypothetical protein